MRKVRIGTIQPAEIAYPRQYRWGHGGYMPDIDAIMQNCILPQAEVTFKLLEQAGEAGADIITTCEDLSHASGYIVDTSEDNVFPEIVRRGYPIIEERLSAIAKKYHMNIVACYYKPYGGELFNLASVFNRKGEIIGEYRKSHIPSNELFQSGAGDDLNVIDTDVGRIGVMICYDIMFPGVAETLSLKGAEIVFHPTFGYGWYDSIGEATVRTRANDGSFYLVTSKNYRYMAAGKSSIVDYWGNVLADAAFEPNVFVIKEVDLDRKKVHPDWHIQTGITGIADMRKRYAAERRPELYGIIGERTVEKYIIPAPGQEQAEFREKLRKNVYHW
jgi:predicted amidohydrolase